MTRMAPRCERCGSALVFDNGALVCPGCGHRQSLSAPQTWTPARDDV